MKIIPYIQAFSHSCLAASLLMIKNEKNISKLEKEIFYSGTKRTYPFYVVGIPFEYTRKLKVALTIYVDNIIFTKILITAFKKNKNIKVVHHKISLKFINELVLESPIICHIDDNYLGDYSHASHFVVVEKFINNKAVIVDPYDGKRKRIREEILEQSIKSLKNHIKMCPILIRVDL